MEPAVVHRYLDGLKRMQGTGEKRKTVGQRSRKLDKAFHSTVKYALRGSPIDEFQTYFPPDSLSNEALNAAYDAYSQVRLGQVNNIFFLAYPVT